MTTFSRCVSLYRIFCVVLTGLICAPFSFAGTIDDCSKAVVFLSQTTPVTEDINGTRMEIWWKLPNTNIFLQKQTKISGSGFIIVSSNVCYLITAKHVAVSMTEDCEIILSGDKNVPLHINLASITGQPGVRWFHHKEADISIHPLPTITSEGFNALSGRAIPIEFLDSQTNLPSRDVVLTAIGFPLGLGAEGEFLPLSRDSKLSSGFLSDGGGKFFLLQDPSVSGYSGGPLIQSGDPRVIATSPKAEDIKVVSGGARCWGFVSGTYADETGGKMCKIIPAFYAVDLIRQAQHELNIVQVAAPSSEKK